MNNGPYFMGLIAHRTMNEYWVPSMIWRAMELEFYDFWSFWVSSIFSSFISLNFFNKLAFCASIFSLPAVSKTNPVPRRSFCWKPCYSFEKFEANIPKRSTFSSKCSIQGSLNTCEMTWFMGLRSFDLKLIIRYDSYCMTFSKIQKELRRTSSVDVIWTFTGFDMAIWRVYKNFFVFRCKIIWPIL